MNLSSKITIGTTTIIRELCIKRLLDSIKDSQFEGRVLVADQNKKPPRFYKSYDCEIIDLEYDAGLSTAHNAVADKLNTKYLLWFDDDTVFDWEACVGLYERMENNPNFDWVSPWLYELDHKEYRSHAGDLQWGGNTIHRKIIDEQKGFVEVDQPSSVAIYRAEIFDKVRWDEDIHLCREHMKFAWDFKRAGFKAACDSNYSFPHGNCGEGQKEYKDLRYRIEEANEIIRKKMGFTKIKSSQYEQKRLIGCGSGRCGTRSLAELINDCSRWECTHEGQKLKNKALPWQTDMNLAYDRIYWLNNRNFRGDVAFYYLPYIETFMEEVIGLKVICLKRNKKDTIDSFIRWMGRRADPPRNPWEDHDGIRWTKNIAWDACYPFIDVPLDNLSRGEYKREQIGRYWEMYYEYAEWLQDEYPERFRIFSIDVLNERGRQEELFDFIEIENPTYQIGIKHHEFEDWNKNHAGQKYARKFYFDRRTGDWKVRNS